MKCFICNKIDVDCVKFGQWAYDTTCGLCVEKQARKHGFTAENVNNVYSDPVELELIVLELTAELLNKQTREAAR